MTVRMLRWRERGLMLFGLAAFVGCGAADAPKSQLRAVINLQEARDAGFVLGIKTVSKGRGIGLEAGSTAAGGVQEFDCYFLHVMGEFIPSKNPNDSMESFYRIFSDSDNEYCGYDGIISNPIANDESKSEQELEITVDAGQKLVVQLMGVYLRGIDSCPLTVEQARSYDECKDASDNECLDEMSMIAQTALEASGNEIVLEFNSPSDVPRPMSVCHDEGSSPMPVLVSKILGYWVSSGTTSIPASHMNSAWFEPLQNPIPNESPLPEAGQIMIDLALSTDALIQMGRVGQDDLIWLKFDDPFNAFLDAYCYFVKSDISYFSSESHRSSGVDLLGGQYVQVPCQLRANSYTGLQSISDGVVSSPMEMNSVTLEIFESGAQIYTESFVGGPYTVLPRGMYGNTGASAIPYEGRVFTDTQVSSLVFKRDWDSQYFQIQELLDGVWSTVTASLDLSYAGTVCGSTFTEGAGMTALITVTSEQGNDHASCSGSYVGVPSAFWSGLTQFRIRQGRQYITGGQNLYGPWTSCFRLSTSDLWSCDY